MKVNILQFENATMQALHEKAATVANAQSVYGPFVGEWWEHYLSVVIEAAQVEQRVASSKDVAEIRGFYDLLCAEHDTAIADLKTTTEMLQQVQAEAAERASAEAARAQLVKDQSVIIAGLHKQLSEAATVNDKLRQELEDVRATTNRAVPAPPETDVEALHDTAIECDAGNVATPQLADGGTEQQPAPVTNTEDKKPVYDNPVTYTARRNPFLK